MSAARGHAWRVLRRALPAAAFSLVFLLASAGSFVLHLGTNAGRRLVAREANALVSGLLVSGLAIEHIAVLAPGRLRVSRATLLDRLGKPVLRAEGLEARFGLFTLLRGILGEGAVRVAIDDVRAERVSVWLTRDPARGGLTLETAFDTRTPSRPGAASTPVFVSLPHLAVATAVVATDLPGIERSRGEVSELLAGFDVSPKGVVITLKSDDARVTGLLPQEIRTRLDGSLRFPGTSSARLPGHAGGVPFEASAGFRGDALELALRSDAATPAAMQKLVPGWPLLVPFAASAEAKGTPRELAARLEGRIENAKLSGAGRLAFTPELRGDLAVHVGGLDLRWFAAEAPATALEVDGRVALALTGAGVTVEATATLPESELSSLRLPPLALTARYAGGHVTGNARVLDPRLATDIDFTVAPGGALAFSSTSRALELGALERYGVSARGRASLRTQGSLTGDRLVVSAETVLDAPSAGGVNARRAVARGRVEGSLRALRDAKLDLVVEGARLELAGIELERFRGTATGTLGTQTLGLEASSPSGVTLEAGAKLSSGGGASLVDARLASRHGAASLEARAERVGFEAGGVTVDGLVVRSGDGGATGSLSARGSRRSLELTLAQLDLGQAFGAFGLGSGAIAGRLDGRARLEENGHERSGHVGVKLTDGAFGPLEGVVAELGVEFEGAELRVDADVGVPALGSVKLQGSGQLEASLFEGRAARELAGEATLSFAALDLGILGRRLLPEGPELAGQVSGKWRVARAEPNALPSASYELQTHGLVVSRKVEGDAAASAVRLDVDSVGELFGERGSHVALSVLDAQGPWLAANIEHGLGAAAFADAAARGAHELERAALGAPLKARVTAYRRPLKMLDLAGASTLEGALSGSVELAGTAELPELAALVTATAPRVPGSRDEDSLEVELHYSAEREHYSLEARTPDDADRVRLRADGHFGWLARGLGSAWSSQGMLLWSDVGLGRLGRSIDVALEGQTSGHCSFDLAPASVTLDGAFEMSRVALDRRAIGSARGRLRAADGRGEASLSFEQGPAALEVIGEAGLSAPSSGRVFDRTQPGMLRATARDFDLSAFAPFVRGTLTRVGGRLNGRGEVDWAGADAAGRRATRLRANATVQNGTASLVAGGGLLQDIDAQILADGDGPLKLVFRAAARSRQPNIKGTASVRFEGPHFKRLDTELELTSFPLLYDGILMGRATTPSGARKLAIVIDAQESGQVIDVFVPAVEVKLPESDDKKLIQLDDDPAVKVADAPRDPEAQLGAAGAGGRTTLKVRLGKSVVVKRGALEVPVGASLTLSPEGRFTGTVTFPPGGVVPAVGQVFRISRGSVTFKNQDVKDGKLAVEASTRVADGTLVELNVSGSVRAPEVRFRSDPPRSQGEIVAALLGIQTETNTNSKGGEQLGRTAMALAMNRLLEGSPLSTLQFGAGETSEGEAVSSVSMRVANKVWLEGRTVKGSNTSINPDERVSGVVDWRFAPSWSLRTQLGDISGVELRWSLRY